MCMLSGEHSLLTQGNILWYGGSSGPGDWSRFCRLLLSADPGKWLVPDFSIYPFGLPLMKPLALWLSQGSIPRAGETILLCNLFILVCHLMVITYLKENDS